MKMMQMNVKQKNWLELKIEGKFWGATAAPVQFS